VGLKAGGDDGLTKPFSPGEPVARLVMRTDEIRIVTALKPVPVRPEDDARAEEAVAVGR
jgi:DNA-binding response OmpR family regulator